MKFRFVLAFAALAAACSSASAIGTTGTWQSLGRINGLIALPNTASCQHRVVNHYWSSKPVFYPTSVNTYNIDNIEFVFNLDLSSLSRMTSNAPANSRFKTALTAYNTTTTAKSLYGAVSVGQYPRVSINLAYADANALMQGSGWGVAPTEVQYYELQEHCSQ